jgi:hypothetical protein
VTKRLQLIFDLDEIRSISVVNQDRSTTRRGSRAGSRSDRVKEKRKEKAAAARTRAPALTGSGSISSPATSRHGYRIQSGKAVLKKKYADPIAHTDRQIRVLERDPRLLASLALLVSRDCSSGPAHVHSSRSLASAWERPSRVARPQTSSALKRASPEVVWHRAPCPAHCWLLFLSSA